MSTTNTPGQVGFIVHFLGSVTVPTGTGLVAQSRVCSYGDEMTFDAAVVEALRDRNGDAPLLRLLDDEAAQVAAWGSVRIRRGPWPEGEPRMEPGSHQWDDARVAALKAASLLSDPDEQRIAAARAREVWGSAPEARSRTIAEYGAAR